MRIPMPAAVLAGGASRRMGRPKAALPYGGSTLLAHQAGRLARLFPDVVAVVKEPPDFDCGPARVVADGRPEHAPLHGLLRALEEAEDRIFVLAVDLPLLADAVIRRVCERSLASSAAAVVPRADGLLQPLAAVWRREVLPLARSRASRGDLSLHGLAEEADAEILGEGEWRELDPSGNSFANVNTVAEYAALRQRV